MNVVIATFNRAFKKLPFYLVISIPILLNFLVAVVLSFNLSFNYTSTILIFDFLLSSLIFIYIKHYLDIFIINSQQIYTGNFQNLIMNEREDEFNSIQNLFLNAIEKYKKSQSLLKKYQQNFNLALKDKIKDIEKSKQDLLTSKNELEINLQQINQLFTIIESTDDAIMICDSNRKVQYINSAFIKLTGFNLIDLQDSNYELLRQGRYESTHYNRRLYDGIMKKLKLGRIFRGVLKAKRKNGKIYDAEMTITPVFNQDKKIIAYNVIERDVTYQEKYKEKVIEKLKYDTLTGLLNREALFDLVQNNLLSEDEITKRIRLRQGLAFYYLDIDQFRKINQNFGYEVGDKVLIEFASRIKNVLIEEDAISRVGGNEFVIILTRVNTLEGAEKIKSEIINQLKISFRIEEHILNISSSIGLALYPTDGLDFEELINKSEENMNQYRSNNSLLKVS